MNKNNVVELSQWKARSRIKNSALQNGWTFPSDALDSISDPVSFYICEPLQSGFSAASVHDRKSIESLVKTGTKKYGTKKKIFETVSVCTMDLITNKKSHDLNLLDVVVTGNIIHFANSETARLAILERGCHHFGVIVYHNPSRPGDVQVTFRPMALSHSEAILDSSELGSAVCSYMFNDYEKHPEYFEGMSFLSVIDRFSSSMGVNK